MRKRGLLPALGLCAVLGLPAQGSAGTPVRAPAARPLLHVPAAAARHPKLITGANTRRVAPLGSRGHPGKTLTGGRTPRRGFPLL